jgi:hypothetical protein
MTSHRDIHVVAVEQSSEGVRDYQVVKFTPKSKLIPAHRLAQALQEAGVQFDIAGLIIRARRSARKVLRSSRLKPKQRVDPLELADCPKGSAPFWARCVMKNASALDRAINSGDLLAATKAAYFLGVQQTLLEEHTIRPTGQPHSISDLAAQGRKRRSDASAAGENSVRARLQWELPLMKRASELRKLRPTISKKEIIATLLDEFPWSPNDSAGEERYRRRVEKRFTKWVQLDEVPRKHSIEGSKLTR